LAFPPGRWRLYSLLSSEKLIIVAIVTYSDYMTTTIQLERKTRLRLLACGRKGETYDEVINALIDAVGGPDEFRLRRQQEVKQQ
jgi:hypothetical protein